MVKKKEETRPLFWDWVRGRATLLFSRFCDIKQRRNCSFLTSSSIAITIKLNDPIVGSLVRDGSRIFNEIHSRGQILYGSFETSCNKIA